MRFDHHCSFMRRLARDVRGNTIAMMAAALVPLMGFAGSAVDFARIYVVKVRLQQACDAGVLAGRKTMTDTSLSTPLDSVATTQANAFFANNFPTGYLRTTALTFTPTKAADAGSTIANAVQATASVRLPMAVMGFFGITSRDLQASCQARFDLADTDVMFVLDTTGSMSCYPSDPATCGNTPITPYTRADGSTGYYNPEKPPRTVAGVTEYSKLESLRQAVTLFDTTMRANADPTTHVRYGFVTYSSAVNVGAIIPPQYVQNTSWTYQSRHLSPTTNGSYTNSAGDYSYGGASNFTFTGVPQTSCVAQRLPTSGFVRPGPTVGSGAAWSDAGYYQARYYYNVSWSSNNSGTCTGKQQPLRARWRYEPTSVNVANYVSSLTTGTAAAVPGRLDGLTSKWRGCIEEVDSSPAASFSLGSLPDDLDPDFIPSDPDNEWRPLWPEAEWLRSDLTNYTEKLDEQIDENNVNDWEDYTYRAGLSLDRSGSVACGMPAQRLKVWTAAQVSSYLTNADFKPFGGTYHDVGMIWGNRMLSPDSVFADSTPWAGRNAPSRNIVFMTDGNMAPQPTVYGQYGVEYWDKRIDGNSSNYGSSPDWDADRHNARFRIACDVAKMKGYTVYVVALGVAANADLTYCASPGQVFTANSTPQLTAAFRSIAQRVAMLRITQ